MNAHLRDNLSFVYTPPAAHVSHSATQSLTNATNTTLAFNGESFDTDTMHDNTTNNSRLTINTTGRYMYGADITFASNATGSRHVWVNLNPVGDRARASGRAADDLAHTENVVNYDNTFTAGSHFITCLARQSSGGALNVLAADGIDDFCDFWAVWRSN